MSKWVWITPQAELVLIDFFIVPDRAQDGFNRGMSHAFRLMGWEELGPL